MYPGTDEVQSIGQFFFIVPYEAVQHRLFFFSHLNSKILNSLDNTMREHHIFSQFYEMMAQEMKDQIQDDSDTPSELHLLFSLKLDMDNRGYNFQRTNEVAAIFITKADG